MCPGQDYDDSFAISQTKPADNAVFYVNAHRLDDTPSSASHHTHQPVKPSLLGAGWGQNLGFIYLAINPNDTQVPDRGMGPRPRIRFSFTTVCELTHGVRKSASLASGYMLGAQGLGRFPGQALGSFSCFLTTLVSSYSTYKEM